VININAYKCIYVSGESFNHTFKPPPKAQRSAAHYETSAYAGPLEIDIYNFEDPQFANSKYVLTSPKSLEACCRLNTKVCCYTCQ